MAASKSKTKSKAELMAAVQDAKKKFGLGSQQYKDAVAAYRGQPAGTATPAAPIGGGTNTGVDTPQQTGLPAAQPGSGNPLTPTSTLASQIKTAVGAADSPEAIAAGRLYEQLMPLSLVDPNISGDASKALSGLQTTMNNALLKDPNQILAMEMMRKNAEQGFSQPEITALTEAGTQGINGELQTALRQMMLRNGAQGTGGNMIGAADIAGRALQARRDLERDNLLANLDFKQKNLENFGDFSNKVNNDWIANQGKAAQNYWTGANDAQNFEQKGTIFNIGQTEKYGSGKLGAIFGGAGTANAKDAQKESLDIARDSIGANTASAMNSFNYGSGTTGNNSSSEWAKPTQY